MAFLTEFLVFLNMINLVQWLIESLELILICFCGYFFCQDLPIFLLFQPMRVKLFFLIINNILVISVEGDRFVTLLHILSGLFHPVFPSLNRHMSSLRNILRARMVWFSFLVYNKLLKFLSRVILQIHPWGLSLLVLQFYNIHLLLLTCIHQSFNMLR